MSEPTAPNRSYEGSCHCGAVRFTVEMDLSRVVACNCSICGRTGALMAFVPASQFHLQAGEDAQTDYQFNKRIIHHLFCTTCGVRTFARGKNPEGHDVCSINVRALAGVDATELPVDHFDGANS